MDWPSKAYTIFMANYTEKHAIQIVAVCEY